MSLLRFEQVELSFGTQILLDKISFTLAAGDRIGLLGRNGAGKSSLLRILANRQQADGGQVWRAPGLRVAELAQELPVADVQVTVYDWVAGGLDATGQLLQRYHALTQADLAGSALQELQRVQTQLEAVDGWQLQQQVDTVLTRLQLPADAALASLSGGWRRRAALARALVQNPDVLLLDEPTNHLDIDAILWLEHALETFRGAVVLITHDRAFLQKLARQIWELDRGQLHQWRGDYRGYLSFREQRLAGEEKTNSEFDKKLAEEERWIRTGIKARRTRNEGRVRALEKMRIERAARRQQQGAAHMMLDHAGESGKLVAELVHVQYCIGARALIHDFSTAILRGDRIGLIGPNGSGKSTLLKLLLGELVPTAGSIKHGTRLEVAYFDQLRASLDFTATAVENVAGGRDFIDVNGKRLHVISYLNNFLFESSRLRTPVSQLSGGEQNRLILAKLFSQPANLLVLDEPTNDLDMETLELLEELLADFTGTVLLVSHDRDFVDHVVTSTLVFDGRGNIGEFVGGYSDWQQHVQRVGHQHRQDEEKNATAAKMALAQPVKDKQSRKLSYQLQRELDALPEKIDALENEIARLNHLVQQVDFFSRDRQQAESLLQELVLRQEELEACYRRWEVLEAQQSP